MAQSPVSPTVDLELVLAVDVSFSMSRDEQLLQRAGYVAAFRRPEVIAAIKTGELGRIAVTYVEWGGSVRQIVPWTILDGPAAAERFATRLSRQPVKGVPFTSISKALAFSRVLLQANRIEGTRQVIDVSGDGPDNSGVPVVLARNRVVQQGIVINGLPIMLHESSPADPTYSPNLDLYFQNCVIGGPGAFALKVSSIDEFSQAILEKLLREISNAQIVTSIKYIPGRVQPSFDCLTYETTEPLR
jgi:hypothetical protein